MLVPASQRRSTVANPRARGAALDAPQKAIKNYMLRLLPLSVKGARPKAIAARASLRRCAPTAAPLIEARSDYGLRPSYCARARTPLNPRSLPRAPSLCPTRRKRKPGAGPPVPVGAAPKDGARAQRAGRPPTRSRQGKADAVRACPRRQGALSAPRRETFTRTERRDQLTERAVVRKRFARGFPDVT